MKRALLPMLALALVATGCERMDGVTAPEASAPAESLLGFGERAPNGYTVVMEKDATAGAVVGVIGSAGGKLVLGTDELWVPKGAVSGPTTFTMSRVGSSLRFSLTATQLLPNDVGSRGFAAPVKLVIDYRDATTNISNPSALRVFWAKPDGTFQAQPTEVDIQGKRAIGSLDHFSDYILAIP